MSNQSAKQASVRAVTGTTYPYEGDWHALFDLAGIPVGTFNGRMLAWINDYLGTSYTELNGAMAAFAVNQGYYNWGSMGTFNAGGSAPSTPVNTVAPALSGDFFVGQTLTCSTGTWSGSPVPTYTYQWRNAGVDIGGATTNQYTLVAGDDGDSITCNVTATNASGSASQISNAVVAIQTTVWLDASDTSTITQTANAVSQWNDKSGSANNATQATGAKQPTTNTRTLNGLNVIDFDGTDDRMNFGGGFRGAMSGAANFTIFAIVLFDNTIATQDVYAMNNGGSTIMVLRQNGANNIEYLGGTTVAVSHVNDTNPHIVGIRRNGTEKLALIDGAVNTNLAGINQTYNSSVGLGYNPQPSGNYVNGIIAEFVIVVRSLTTAEMNQMGNSFGSKWGISWTNI